MDTKGAQDVHSTGRSSSGANHDHNPSIPFKIVNVLRKDVHEHEIIIIKTMFYKLILQVDYHEKSLLR